MPIILARCLLNQVKTHYHTFTIIFIKILKFKKGKKLLVYVSEYLNGSQDLNAWSKFFFTN